MTGKATRTTARPKAAAPIPPTTRTTRARSATATSTVTVTPDAIVPAKKTVVRKPLVNRDAPIDANTRAPAKTAVKKVPTKAPAKAAPTKAAPTKPAQATKAAKKNAPSESEGDREPIMAYLRIRPYLGEDEPTSLPYLTPLSDTSVRMVDPHHEGHATISRFRPSTLPPTSIYTFSHIFPPATTQSDFFTKTTLPLVHDVLRGQNALLFTYGVTNSGKTFTVQGGDKEGSAGILPRTLDVVFNSIKDLHSDGRYRPVRLQGVELADPSDSDPDAPQLNLTVSEPALAQVLAQHMDSPSAADTDVDPTVLQLDRNYEYSIWLSYAEVYNEKIYDLLASVQEESSSDPRPRSAAHPLLLTRKALPLKPSPPSDSPSDTITIGKYISGLRQFRVHSASQAKALVKLGQLHRRVFGTLANRESSRSHGMVILKIVRGHRGERADPTALQIARLTLVDLAGSERTKHTQTTGDRLKEAGNINKSLMVLGQCMEVMRANQRRVATSLTHTAEGKEGRMDTRDVKKGLAVVPFRHSKLTEALMDYFIGDGRAVMIVNVNPYDTGYDENSHVMKFAALAREVFITPAPAPLQRVPSVPNVGPGKMQGTVIRQLGPLTLKGPDIAPMPYRRKVTLSTGGGGGRKPSEAILEVLEEDEPVDEEDLDADDEPINPLVDALFDEVEDLRIQLFEAEMRCAIVEAETREEVMREMEERMQSMERMYARRLMTEVEQNEMKTDAKIDMLHQSGLFRSSAKKAGGKATHTSFDEGEEEDVENSLIDYGDDDSEPDASGEVFLSESGSQYTSARNRSLSASPLAGKGRTKTQPRDSTAITGEIRIAVPDGPEGVRLPSDGEDSELTETEDESGADEDDAPTEMSDQSGEEEDGYQEDTQDEEDDDEEDEWMPMAPAPSSNKQTSKGKVGKSKPSSKALPTDTEEPKKPLSAKPGKLSQLQREMNAMSLSSDGNADDSVIVLPTNKKLAARQPAVPSNDEEDEKKDEDEDAEMNVAAIKKKKRQLGKKPVMTEEQIERATAATARESGTHIRRMTGR